jgi:ABC-type branched-subunit amino acid transport system ATPase component
VARDFSARIMRGDRFGIVGPNGAGKNLLNLLTGELMPDTRRGPARHQPRAGGTVEQIDRAAPRGVEVLL